MKQPLSSSALPIPKFFSVDFFCGAGGTTRGLLDAGGYVLAGIDKDKRCEETYIKNNRNICLDKAKLTFLHRDIFPATTRYPGGQQDTLFKEVDLLVKKARSEHPSTPLLFAICAPCQPFTKVAKKKLSKERAKGRKRDMNLLKEAVKFVDRFKPEMVLSENVQGIGDPKYGGVWETFRRKLNKLGYVTGADVVCTSNFGIPQYRRRSILLAIRKSKLAEPYKSLAMIEVPRSDPEAPKISVKEALEKAALPAIVAGGHSSDDPNHRARSLCEINLRRLRAAKPGQSNAYMDEAEDDDLALPCHRKVNKRLGMPCFTDVYTRMHPDRPSPTITTKCHSISNGRFGHYDTTQIRGISLREAAILQSFPKEYVFYPVHQIEPIARMIGNAVPPKLAEFYSGHLAELVRPSRSRF